MLDLRVISELSWNLKLLYVEDNLEARESTLYLLEDFFENITSAIDGEDGLEKFKLDTFDLVITDINMPRLDGLGMAEEIKKIDSDIHIIVLSAHQEVDFFTKSLQIDIDGYLFKPLDIDKFAELLYKVSNDINDKINIEKEKEEDKEREERRVNKIILHGDRRDNAQREKIKKIESINQHTKDSIKYASLIQSAILPDNSLFSHYFKDHFILWHPKDTVGGDIFLFSELRDHDECLFMFIDCTGHGVAGAFVTMLVKAVETQILTEIKNEPNIEISPAIIMGYFNVKLKKILKQETKDSVSNAGWDGGIIYYNRRKQIIKFAGAETPLFYMDTDGSFHTIKGNRYSVGYKNCSIDYKYKETVIEVKEGMKFYCTTDGYLDQNGGDKDFPFGKKRFGKIIKNHYKKEMTDIREMFLYEMDRYESMVIDNERNDDITVIGFEIDKALVLADTLLEYEGVLTQGIISHSLDLIEQNIDNIGIIGNISTIVIELTQNMMKYSKSQDLHCRDIRPSGLIEIKRDKENIYYISSKNILSIEDKNKIEPIVTEIQNLDHSGIKKMYRELRKSGKNTHAKGGGIGFYEIGKLAESISFSFKPINEDKFIFKFQAMIKGKNLDNSI